jgi:UDP-glucose 4-epimerase
MTKFIGEKMLADFESGYGIRFSALRYFNAAGADFSGDIGEAHDPEHHILPLIFKTALGKREKFYVFGKDYDTEDGTCLRDYIHVRDLANAHYLALKYIMEKDVSEAFNLGSSQGYTVLEIIKAFERVAGVKLKYELADRRPGDPARLVASNDKIRDMLGWRAEFSDIDTIIKSAWAWEQNRKFGD